MVAPQDPRSLAQRVRRLELLLISQFLTTGDESDDDELFYLFRRFFWRGDRDVFDGPEFKFFLDRVSEHHRRSQPEPLLRQIEQLQKEVQALKAKTDTVQIETHSLLAIQAFGLPTDRVRSTRYVPVRAYIDQTPEGAIDAISAAITDVLSVYGFAVADEFPEIKGSWFKKWFAKSNKALSQPEVIERLEKIERAVDLKANGTRLSIIAQTCDSIVGRLNVAYPVTCAV